MAAAAATGGIHTAAARTELQDGARCYPSDLGGSRGHWHCQVGASEENTVGHQASQGYHQRQMESGWSQCLSAAGKKENFYTVQ